MASEVMVLIGIIMSFRFTAHYSIPQYVISALITFVFAEVLEGMLMFVYVQCNHLNSLCTTPRKRKSLSTAKPNQSIIFCLFIRHATTDVEQCRSESILAFASNVVKAFPRDLQWWTPLDRGRDIGPCNRRCHNYRSRLSRHGPTPQRHASATSCDMHCLDRCNSVHLQHALLKRHACLVAVCVQQRSCLK